MAPVIHTPVEGFTGVVVGVNFTDGVGETDDPAALGYFQSAGYEIEHDAVPPAGTPLTPEELARVAATEAARDAGATPTPQGGEPSGGDQSGGEPSGGEPAGETPKRPYPQANKAEWFAYLSEVKPDHGLSLEDNTKAEIIAAVPSAN